jgi:hypothetical protein
MGAGRRAHGHTRRSGAHQGIRAHARGWVVRPVLLGGLVRSFVGLVAALGELRMGRIYRDGYMSVYVRICPISLESLY